MADSIEINMGNCLVFALVSVCRAWICQSAAPLSEKGRERERERKKSKGWFRRGPRRASFYSGRGGEQCHRAFQRGVGHQHIVLWQVREAYQSSGWVGLRAPPPLGARLSIQLKGKHSIASAAVAN